MMDQDATILSDSRSVVDGFGSCGSELEPTVEYVDRESDFCRLRRDVLTPESAADELLVCAVSAILVFHEFPASVKPTGLHRRSVVQCCRRSFGSAHTIGRFE